MSLARIVYNYIGPTRKEAEKRLDRVRERAGWARGYAEMGTLHHTVPIGRWSWMTGGSVEQRYGGWLKNPERSAWALQQCEWITQSMQGEQETYYIGETLEDLLALGVLLADVHQNNLGWVRREDYYEDILVITDPGRALVLDPSLEFPSIREI